MFIRQYFEIFAWHELFVAALPCCSCIRKRWIMFLLQWFCESMFCFKLAEYLYKVKRFQEIITKNKTQYSHASQLIPNNGMTSGRQYLRINPSCVQTIKAASTKTEQ